MHNARAQIGITFLYSKRIGRVGQINHLCKIKWTHLSVVMQFVCLVPLASLILKVNTWPQQPAVIGRTGRVFASDIDTVLTDVSCV